MCGWRGKLIRTVIVFFAGFATAIYTLAPAANDVSSPRTNAGSELQASALPKVEAVAQKLKRDLKKCAVFTQEKAVIVKDLIEAQLAEEDNDES